jgi:HK97 family phage major capsid protein
VQTALHFINEARRFWERADAEDRPMTADERYQVDQLLDRAEQAKAFESRVNRLDGAAWERGVGDAFYVGDVGKAFTESTGFKAIADPASRPQRWTTGPIEVSSGPLTMQAKAGTLLETGQGSGLIPVPQVIPGQVQTLFQPLGIADLFASGTATVNSVRYVVEGTATSGAAGVAEGGTKPASDLALSTVDEPVKKIATSLIVSDELIDDATGIQNYLNSRLTLFVQMEEERQLLRGGGTNELVGLIGRSGINAYSRGTIDNNAVAIAKVIANTRGSSYLEPDGVIMHPTNWLTMRLLTDSAGQFFGGGPFGAAYGNPQAPPGVFGQTLWGKPVVLSTVVGQGTAVVGAFRTAAQIFRRGGVTVEMSNSHASLFLSDEVAIRAEERLALACYRAPAFTVVSGLS